MSADEYRCVPLPHVPGWWIIVHSKRLRDFENESVNAMAYASREEAEAAIVALTDEVQR